MRNWVLYSFSIGALLNTSCGTEGIGGTEICPEGATYCTPGQPWDPNSGPEVKWVKSGPGTGVPFDPKGSGTSGVKLDPNGNIVVDGAGNMNSLNSYIWVSQNGNGTISKVDTRSMRQVGAYVTRAGGGADPSRTTVGLGGDAVVANRGGASATKIAGQKSSCVDRNGNGKIDTYESDQALTTASPFWWKSGQVDSPDECVLWSTALQGGSYVRAAGFDGKLGIDGSLGTYVYIGEYSTWTIVRLDAKTGAVVKRIQLRDSANGLGVCPYGLVLDRAGNVWATNEWSSDSPGGCGGLCRIEVSNNDKVTCYNKPSGYYYSGYGLTADARGYIYLASYGNGGNSKLFRFIPPDNPKNTLKIPVYEAVQIGQNLRGVGVDQNNQAFAAVHNGGMAHVDAAPEPNFGAARSGNLLNSTNMTLKKLLTSSDGIYGTTAGAAIDYDGNAWGVSHNMAYKIEPTKNYNVTKWQPFASTYTYSDMTGYQLRNASRAGVYRNVFTGCGSRTSWKELDWAVSAPPGSQATIRYRAALTVAELVDAPWQGTTGISPSAIVLPPDTKASFLEVEVVLQTSNDSVNPMLSNLQASFTCNQTPA